MIDEEALAEKMMRYQIRGGDKEKITHAFNETCKNLKDMSTEEIEIILELIKCYTFRNTRLFVENSCKENEV